MYLTFQSGPELKGSKNQILTSLLGLSADCRALSRIDLCLCTDQEITDALDKMTHLMNGYLAAGEPGRMDEVIRLQSSLLSQARERELMTTVPCSFYETWFLRTQAMFYELREQRQTAADYFYRFSEAEQRCFYMISQDGGLENEQKKYLVWMCLRGLREALRSLDAVGAAERSREILQRCGDRAEWLMPYSAGDFELLRKLTEIYSGLGGPMYFHGSPKIGREYFDKAIAMFRYLARAYKSEHCLIMALWTKALWATQESMYLNNHRLLTECRNELRRVLDSREFAPADQAIAAAAKGITVAQMANCLLQRNRDQKGLQAAQQSCRQLKNALEGLNAELEFGMGSCEKGTIQAIGSHVFGCYAGALDTLGVLQYRMGQWENARQTLLKAIEVLDTQSRYHGAKTMADQIRAECCEYLGLIYNNWKDGEQALFYCEYAILYAKSSNLTARLPILIFSGTLASEILMDQKKKERACYYAQTGLDACRELAAVEPDHQILSLEENLRKVLKKASRKFF